MKIFQILKFDAKRQIFIFRRTSTRYNFEKRPPLVTLFLGPPTEAEAPAEGEALREALLDSAKVS